MVPCHDSLCIRWATLEQASELSALPALLSRLHSLALGDARMLNYVGDDLLRVLGDAATQLTSLDLAGCVDVTDNGRWSLWMRSIWVGMWALVLPPVRMGLLGRVGGHVGCLSCV